MSLNLNLIKKLKEKEIILAVVLIFALLAFTVEASLMGTINPGFEGAKCDCYGIYFGDWSGDWDNKNMLHVYGDPEIPIMYWPEYNILNQLVGEHKVSWTTFGTPNDVGVGCHNWKYPLTPKVWDYPELNIEVESNVQLSEINKQGDPDPLGYNSENPLQGRRIEYWGLKGVKATETEDKVIYEYELTKESFLIVPAEFWVGFSLTASQTDAGTASGWCEGEWKDMTAWFRLDFHIWDNAYYDDWFDDPQVEVFKTEYGGTITSQQKLTSPDAYRGGFPIAGWIQGWEKADMTSDVWAGKQQSSIWYNIKGDKEGKYTDDQLYELREILMAKCEFSPGMVGQYICLYDEPDIHFTYVEPSNTNFDKETDLTQSVKVPDSAMQKVMYFPINIQNFGTYAEAKGYMGVYGWNVYYPSAYFRVRMIYGVYGSFKYLWTEEVTKSMDEGGLDFPEEIERHGTTVITTTGPLTPFEGIASWFANPFNQLWIAFITIVIVVLVVTFLNPGLWGNLALAYKSTKKKIKKG